MGCSPQLPVVIKGFHTLLAELFPSPSPIVSSSLTDLIRTQAPQRQVAPVRRGAVKGLERKHQHCTQLGNVNCMQPQGASFT